jgi:hypothetical protein
MPLGIMGWEREKNKKFRVDACISTQTKMGN